MLNFFYEDLENIGCEREEILERECTVWKGGYKSDLHSSLSLCIYIFHE
jgi:hypothetical protein